jgi:hypothetical protein
MGGDFVAGANVPEEDLDNENFVANERVAFLSSFPFLLALRYHVVLLAC